MREPSQWNTIIAISHAVLFFTAVFTGLFAALAAVVWTPVAVVKAGAALVKRVSLRQEIAEPHIVTYESDMHIPSGYAIVERLARHTARAWPTVRL